MSKLAARIQALKDKAAMINAAIHAAPARATQLRDAVQQTTAQLREAKSGITEALAGLKSEGEGALAEALVELTTHFDVLERIGYRLQGFDLEQGLIPRVILHLEEIGGDGFQSKAEVLKELPGGRFLPAILRALEQADSWRGKVRLPGLKFTGLVVHVGPVPTVRLCWRPSSSVADGMPNVPPRLDETPPMQAASTPASPASGGLWAGGYGAGSFFESRSGSAASSSTVADTEGTGAAAARSEAPTSSPPKPAARSDQWRQDALARFKKMPDLSR